VNVRVELQTLGPGMEHGHKAAGVSAQSFIGCELLGQRAASSREEQIKGLSGMKKEKVSVPAIVEIPIDIIGPLAIFGGVWGENCESNIPARSIT
jgi:hypothetical protein